MNKPNSQPKSLNSPATLTKTLNYEESYLCPVCRHGQITGLTLMDAFACDFCRHIFTANLKEQTVQVVDSSQPMSWRWVGRRWQVAYRDDLNLSTLIWIISIVVITLPPSLVGLAAYIFPPLPGSRWAWFPFAWAGGTLVIHLGMVLWLIAEHYQIPFYVSTKIRLQAAFREN
jgi:hypothetical protein